MSSVEYRLAELERKLANLQMVGVIFELDEAAARVKVRCGELESGWLPWFTRRAGGDRDWWSPEVGEQVMVFSPCGDPAQGVVLPSIYRNAHPAPANSKNVRRIIFADGTVVEYDRAAHLLKADVKGDVQLLASGTLVANITGNTTLTTPTATINGDLVVNGEVSVSKSVAATLNITAGQNIGDQGGSKTMAAMRTTYNAHQHPENGDGGGTTSAPNQQQ